MTSNANHLGCFIDKLMDAELDAPPGARRGRPARVGHRAARELHYSQPSVSHHLARLEAATGAKLIQRVGRGIRLTPEGELLAQRAAEIIGRVDAAAAELAAQVGLRAGRVRLAGFQSVLSTIWFRTRRPPLLPAPTRASS